ncbi:MAG TPA: hypothetical protein VGI60_14785 [Chthoniobacterales bacterium]|jgi:hypothetical protein
MIEKIEYSDLEPSPGDLLRVTVIGSGRFELSVSCFIDNPPPPRFAPCDECRTKSVRAGEAFEMIVPSDLEGRSQGLQFDVRDLETSQTITQRIQIKQQGNERGRMMASA